MRDRDPRRQRRRRVGARLSDADSHSPEAVGVGERTTDSPSGVPSTVAESTPVTPTPQMDARLGTPFLDPNHVPGLNHDAGLQSANVGNALGTGGLNPAFWSTFGSFMPYNANLIMSALSSMQQGQPLLQPPQQSTPHPAPHPAVDPTPQRTPEPRAQATSQQSGGRILPWSEQEVVVRDKSLIEPEGDTYILYYPLTIYELFCVHSSVVLIRCCDI